MNKTYCKNVIKDLNKKYILDKIVDSNFKFYKDNVKPSKRLRTVRDLISYIKYKNIPIPNIVLQYKDLRARIFKILKYFSFICIIYIDNTYYKISNIKDNIPILYFDIKSYVYIQYSRNEVKKYILEKSPSDISKSRYAKNIDDYLNNYIFDYPGVFPDLYTGGKL